MSTGGIVAFVTLLVTYMGTLIGSWVAISNLRHSVAKEHANRRISLENYAEQVGRYIRALRVYLLDRVKAGMICPHCDTHIDDVIDASLVDMSKFVPPPQPKYNGN